MAKQSLADMDATELAEALKDRALNEIDKQLKLVNSRLDTLQPLIELRDRLQASRRAMLNERSVASGGGRGLSQSEVVNALNGSDGMSVYELAQKLSVSEAVVRGHLNRGKDERFSKLDQHTWVLREPENDPEEDEDDE